jgi:hypothetical protein
MLDEDTMRSSNEYVSLYVSLEPKSSQVSLAVRLYSPCHATQPRSRTIQAASHRLGCLGKSRHEKASLRELFLATGKIVFVFTHCILCASTVGEKTSLGS